MKTIGILAAPPEYEGMKVKTRMRVWGCHQYPYEYESENT
jgi:hypothetical protein